MTELRLFTDGSVNPQLKVGYGAYLAVAEGEVPLESLESSVKVMRFEQTSSTKLELQTLLWALSDISALGCRVIVHTDSQNVIGLHGRRARFEQNDYMSKKNRRIANYALYQEFYKVTDQLECEFVKVRGHKLSHQKDETDRLFTLVDRASRKALREDDLC
ncbi:MAG: RNase H family protein [Sulfurimonadaceae bacterium]